MLLLQFGTYDWEISPKFEIDTVRQLMTLFGGDEVIWQFHSTHRFSTEPELTAIKNGRHWRHNHLTLGDFYPYVKGYAVFKLFGDRDDPEVVWRTSNPMNRIYRI